MPQRHKSRHRWRFWSMLVLVPTLWIGYGQMKAKLREPQAILVLGGDAQREHFAAELARQNPALEVWVSSGTNPEYAEWLFQEANVEAVRVHLDYRAVDTVTNFTTIVRDLKAQGIQSVYLVTSDYHMRRAAIIGQIVLGRHDIAFQTIPVPSEHPESESLARGLRDGARAVWWVFTGKTGSSLRQTLSKS
ncbi:MAG: YdcF family protein [Leptolyngbyaceae cyanobacterium]